MIADCSTTFIVNEIMLTTLIEKKIHKCMTPCVLRILFSTMMDICRIVPLRESFYNRNMVAAHIEN